MFGATREQDLAFAPFRAERILYDENGLLVVDKPAKMVVHGGREGSGLSLVERLTEMDGGRLRGRLFVHSRLDVETSGLILFSTERERSIEVQREFEAHRLERLYVALVSDPQRRLAASGKLEVQLRHDDGKSRVVKSGGQVAITHYRQLRREGSRVLLELKLETGRTHQIRVSLAHLGAPVIGDTLYGGELAPRLALHAVRLSGSVLPRPIESPLPAFFQTWLSRGQYDCSLEGDAWRQALLDAICWRAPLLKDTQALRLVNAEADGLPGLTIDLYGHYACLNPYEASLEPLMAPIAEQLLALGLRGVYLKQRVKADLRKAKVSELAPDAVFRGDAAPRDLVIREGSLQIAIDLEDGLSTGLFVDQRENRQRVQRCLQGGAMLNLFCYTSSFSLAAAQSGASTVSVDLSGRALERSRHNFTLNGLALERHRFIKEDALKFLPRAVRRGDKFRLIVLDPPSFASVGKGTFSVKQQYLEAAQHCFELLEPGGMLLAVTNHNGTSQAALAALLRKAAGLAQRSLVRQKDLSSSEDCPASQHGPWPSKSVLCTLA